MRYHSWGMPLTSNGFTKPIKQKAPNNLADESTSNRCKDKDTRFVGAGTISQFDLFNTNEIGNPSGNNLKSDVKDYKAYNSYERNAGVWTLYTRQGIQWLPTCKHSKSDFIKVSDKIKTIQTTQQAAYIVQLIFGLCILGIFFPIMAAMQFWEKDQDLMCIPGEGLEERRNLGICKSVCSFLALLLKIIFIAIASSATQPVYEIYDGASTCAIDKLTKSTVSTITPEVKRIHDGNTMAFQLALISLGFCILNWLYQFYKGCKVDMTLADEEGQGVALSETGPMDANNMEQGDDTERDWSMNPARESVINPKN